MDGGLWRIVLQHSFPCVLFLDYYVYVIRIRPIEIGVLSRIVFARLSLCTVFTVSYYLPPPNIFFYDFLQRALPRQSYTIAACYTDRLTVFLLTT
jgi:hypothetical protein